MKDDDKNKKDGWVLKNFHLGLSHQRAFRISDIQGFLVDAVLLMRGKGSFPPGCFPLVQRPDVFTVTLTDEAGTLSVVLNVDGVILRTNMEENSHLTVNQVEEMFKDIVDAVIPITETKDKITRIGIVHEYEMDGFENSAKTMFSEYVKADLKGTPDNIFLRFALKHPTEKALASLEKKGDFQNVIFTLSSGRAKEDADEGGKDEEGEAVEKVPTIMKAIIDYQMYYVPPTSLKNVNVKGLVSDSEKYIERLKETGTVLK